MFRIDVEKNFVRVFILGDWCDNDVTTLYNEVVRNVADVKVKKVVIDFSEIGVWNSTLLLAIEKVEMVWNLLLCRKILWDCCS